MIIDICLHFAIIRMVRHAPDARQIVAALYRSGSVCANRSADTLCGGVRRGTHMSLRFEAPESTPSFMLISCSGDVSPG